MPDQRTVPTYSRHPPEKIPFRTRQMGLGPMLAFLTFGPVVNLKSAPLYFRLFSVPAVVLMAVLVTQLAFVSAAVVELRSW